MSQPRRRNASTRSPIGRSCIRGTPATLIVAAQHREHRGQRAHGGARVAEEEAALRAPEMRRPRRRSSHAARRVRSMRTPSARSASCICAVSSASSRPIEPRRAVASAASSSVRLEMLFEPGSATVPSARAIGATSSWSSRPRSCAAHFAALALAAIPPAVSPHCRRDGDAREQHRVERRAVAVRDRQRQCVERSRGTRSSSASSASRLASAMSRHISGELPAMRVKSRKPLPALPKYSARPCATRARRRARTRADAAGATPPRRCCRVAPASSRATRAPHAVQKSRDERVRVRRRLGQRRQDHVAADDTATDRRRRRRVRSLPAIGWPGTNCGSLLRRASRARRATTSCLVLPASVTTVRASQRAGECRQHRTVLRDGHRDQDEVGIGDLGRPVGVEQDAAIDDAARERAIEIALRATDADDVATPRRRARNASAHEAPISPTPMTTSLSMCTRVSAALARERACASAARKRAFSAGRPTVTRSHAGRP